MNYKRRLERIGCWLATIGGVSAMVGFFYENWVPMLIGILMCYVGTIALGIVDNWGLPEQHSRATVSL